MLDNRELQIWEWQQKGARICLLGLSREILRKSRFYKDEIYKGECCIFISSKTIKMSSLSNVSSINSNIAVEKRFFPWKRVTNRAKNAKVVVFQA